LHGGALEGVPEDMAKVLGKDSSERNRKKTRFARKSFGARLVQQKEVYIKGF